MMLKIYNDLKENVKKIYGGSNIISVNKYVHHSLNYQEMQEIFTKYKGNIKKFKNELYKHIEQYELNQEKKEFKKPKRQSYNFGNSQLINDFLGEDFQDFFNEGLNPNNIYEEQELQLLFNNAKKIEINKIQRLAQETGQIYQPEDISIESLFRAVIELGKSNQKYSHIYKLIKESGLDIEKFIKDDSLGKSKNKKIIEELCTNLNKKAQEGKLQTVFGRENEIEQLVNILKKARKNNPVLTGRAGVGKTAIVEGLAKRIIEGEVPEALKKAVIYELQVMNIVKGTNFRGQFEQKMSDLLEEFKDLEASGELPILFIDELHTIMGAGSAGQGGLDFSNIIKPALARGELRTIGATTTEEWHKFIKENPALDRRFIGITIKEPSVEDTQKILEGSLPFYEKTHNVKYDHGTIFRAIELSQQFIVDNALPDKAFDLLDYAGAMCSVKNKSKVKIEDIEYALARQKNIDLDSILETRKDNLEALAPKIKEVIFGQDKAVEKVSKTVEKVLAGLNAKDKPYGAFLFTGPTGTGKTELAKQLAKAMKAHFHRIDMSEFQEAHSVAKITGSPAGYVGYDDGSSLARIINDNPRMVLLLDEIEKAHPDVHKLFLQAMDYGKLTDSKGREINFRNVLLIMTSNAGVKQRTKAIGFTENTTTNLIDHSEIDKIFPPEFRARLTGNGPIEFNPLTKELMLKIVDKYITEIQNERLNSLFIKLEVSDTVKNHLAELGLSKNLGARPVKDYIEHYIIDNLTDEILFGKLKKLTKFKTVRVELSNSEITLKF